MLRSASTSPKRFVSPEASIASPLDMRPFYPPETRRSARPP
jgi:hypothetical protein